MKICLLQNTCKMQRVFWKRNKTLCALIAVVIFFLLFRLRTNTLEKSVLLKKVKPTVVWEFVADFSNMKHLNPTITDFNIVEEKGNYDHWQYSTEYSERLQFWPYLHHNAVAHFSVKASPKNDIYYINSVHTTCFIGRFLCLNAKSEFRFSNASGGTSCEETIEYQCPAVFSKFCFWEIDTQRNVIMENLKKHFKR